MTLPRIATRDGWRRARIELPAEEKELPVLLAAQGGEEPKGRVESAHAGRPRFDT